MASLSSNHATLAPIASHPLSTMTTRIEPPLGWFDLRLKELWDYRELLYFLVWRSVKVRYKQTAIGVVWVVIQPLLTVLTFTLFFGKLAKLPSQGLPYPVFYFAAAVPWMYFSTALTKATNVVVENQSVITKVYFPRLILPISSVLSGLVDFGIVFVVLVIFTLSYGFRPGLGVLLLPIFLLIAVLTALGVGLWLSALNALYRDVLHGDALHGDALQGAGGNDTRLEHDPQTPLRCDEPLRETSGARVPWLSSPEDSWL